MSGYRPVSQPKRGKHLPWIGGVFFAICALVLLLSVGHPPALERLMLSQQQMTLANTTDFPLMDYASLTFAEGGGLCRLYDRSQLEHLQIGQTYDLTIGHPPSSRSAKGGMHMPNYTVIVEMIAADGTVITTEAAYLAQNDMPLHQLLVMLAAILAAAVLVYILYLLLRTVLLFIR